MRPAPLLLLPTLLGDDGGIDRQRVSGKETVQVGAEMASLAAQDE